MKKIHLKLNGKVAYFELFEKEAPITCQRLLDILPQKIDIHYAKFAGQEIFGVLPMMAPIEGGKSLDEIEQGCVAFYPDRAFFCTLPHIPAFRYCSGVSFPFQISAVSRVVIE